MKNAAMNTWKTVVGMQGKNIITELFPTTLEFYIDQLSSISKDSRFAACNCISELATKVITGNPDTTRIFIEHLGEIYSAMIKTCKDS